MGVILAEDSLEGKIKVKTGKKCKMEKKLKAEKEARGRYLRITGQEISISEGKG
jgi:hypothetical protein